MSSPSTPVAPPAGLLHCEISDGIAHVQLRRPEKRNALNDALIRLLADTFRDMPSEVRAIVLSGAGEHFCAGLDLSALGEHSVAEGIHHSRMWHAAFDWVQFGRAPVVAVLRGAVVGGGLELAAAAHVRVAEASTFYALPEGQRGLFTGGGAAARVARLVGVARMTDMMLTGRVLDADEGLQAGLATYLEPAGAGLDRAFALARKIAANAPLSNYAVMQALPRIADLSQSDGLFVESLMAAIAQGDEEAKQRMRAFLEGRAARVQRA